MLLNGREVVRRGIIDDVGPKSMRAASYDLRVGTILARGNLEVTRATEYELPPQGMVEVISLEKLTLPSNVLGYATVKTRLSDRCVLALGIGLIDPGYDSYVSSTLVNFGTQPLRLERGDVFLRTTFHEYVRSEDEIKKTHIDFEDYFQDKREKVLTRFSRTFLNLDQTAKAALDVIWKKVIAISAVAALVVAETIGTIRKTSLRT
jgi:deoxycytidine triphosphate deaminase